jgi:hypothetical protein
VNVSRTSRRYWSFALALALLIGQWAGVRHGFEHVRYELAMAAHAAASASGAAQDEGSLPTLDHSRDHCLVFQGLDCGAVSHNPPILAASIFEDYRIERGLQYRPSSVSPFSSRAPPVFS